MEVTRRRFLQTVGASTAGITLLGNPIAVGASEPFGRSREAASLTTSQTFQDGLDRSKVHFVDVHGVRTRYYEDGQGDPMLLLHGGGFGPGYSLDAWSL